MRAEKFETPELLGRARSQRAQLHLRRHRRGARRQQHAAHLHDAGRRRHVPAHHHLGADAHRRSERQHHRPDAGARCSTSSIRSPSATAASSCRAARRTCTRCAFCPSGGRSGPHRQLSQRRGGRAWSCACMRSRSRATCRRRTRWCAAIRCSTATASPGAPTATSRCSAPSPSPAGRRSTSSTRRASRPRSAPGDDRQTAGAYGELRVSNDSLEVSQSVLDMNGDGVLDLVRSDDAPASAWSVYWGCVGGDGSFGFQSTATRVAGARQVVAPAQRRGVERRVQRQRLELYHDRHVRHHRRRHSRSRRRVERQQLVVYRGRGVPQWGFAPAVNLAGAQPRVHSPQHVLRHLSGRARHQRRRAARSHRQRRRARPRPTNGTST